MRTLSLTGTIFILRAPSVISWTANGKTIASSNRNDSDSFVGKSYQFRPYFTQAIQRSLGRYFALGATSLKRGFYASYPVRDGKGSIIGVAVIKQDLDAEESFLTNYPNCFVIDPNGIIFLSEQEGDELKEPLAGKQRDKALPCLNLNSSEKGNLRRSCPVKLETGMEITFEGKKHLVSRKAINPEGWSIVLMTTTERVLIYKLAGVIITILICTFIIVPLVISYKTSRSAEMVRENEQKFRAVFEQAFQLVGMMTIDGILLSANKAALMLSGVKEADVIGRPFWEAPWWSHSAELQETLRLAVKKAAAGEFVRFDATHPAADGSIRHVDFSLRPVLDDAGKVIFLVPEGRDITDRKLAEEALRESEIRYRDLVENATDLICTHDLKGTLLSVNAAAAKAVGFAAEEVVGLCIPDLLPQDRRQEFNDYIKTIQSDGTATGTMKILTRNGEARFWEYRNTLRTEGVPEPVVRGMARDVTGEVLAKRALKKSEKKYRQLFERNLAGVYRTTIDGRLLDCNDAFARIYGYESREEAMQHKAMDLHVSPKARQEYISTLQARGMLLDFEIQGRRKDGSLIWLLENVTLVHGEEDGLTEMDGTLVDITDRKRAEEALRESEKKYRNILENIEDGYFEVDTAGNFTFFNDSMCRILGYSADELMGKNNREYTDDKNAKKIFKVFNEVYKTGIPTKAFDWELIRKDGSKCFVETVVSLITDSNNVKTGFRGIARDVTERKRSEEELDNSFKRLRAALGATIQAVAVTVETRDPYTAGHQKRVADLSRAIATEMGLDINRTDGIRMAGVIHDLGKMAVPAEILSKPSRLSAIEYRLIKTHPQAGYDILKDVEFPWPIAQIVLQHHERLDGSGYPAGLKGEEILLEARIIAVADVVEAIASFRPYRSALGMEKALGEITKNKGILYDPAAVDACLCLFRDRGYKFV